MKAPSELRRHRDTNAPLSTSPPMLEDRLNLLQVRLERLVERQRSVWEWANRWARREQNSR